MAIKECNVAIGVRVVLNEKFEPKCIGDENLLQEDIIYITQEKAYNTLVNDEIKYYVHIGGGSHTQSGTAALDELDLEFPYDVSDMLERGRNVGKVMRHNQPRNHSNVFITRKSGDIEKVYYQDGYFQRGTTGMNWLRIGDILGWVYQEDLKKIIEESTTKLA